MAVVNQNLADHYWPNGDAVGRRFRFGAPDGPWVEVVGVAANGKYRTVAEPPIPFLFVPRQQATPSPDRGSLIVHSSVPPASLIEQIRVESRDLDDQVLLLDVTTLESHLSRTAFMPAKATAMLVSLFGLLGFGLALLGLYGLLTYSVSRRTQEIGVRMALGASRAGILRMIVTSGMRLTLAGVLVGLLLSLATSRLLAGLLYEVSTVDWVTFTAVPIAVLAVALLSCWLPARRATRVDPITALRYE